MRNKIILYTLILAIPLLSWKLVYDSIANVVLFVFYDIGKTRGCISTIDKLDGVGGGTAYVYTVQYTIGNQQFRLKHSEYQGL